MESQIMAIRGFFFLVLKFLKFKVFCFKPRNKIMLFPFLFLPFPLCCASFSKEGSSEIAARPDRH